MTLCVVLMMFLVTMTAQVMSDHGYGHQDHGHGYHDDYYHKPYYNYQYGVEAYGHGYHGHGHHDKPLNWKVQEHRDGYDTKGQYHVELPGKSYKHHQYHVSSQHLG